MNISDYSVEALDAVHEIVDSYFTNYKPSNNIFMPVSKVPELYKFEGFDWDTDEIQIMLDQESVTVMPVQIHHKKDSTTNGSPGFAIVSVYAKEHEGPSFYTIGQISLSMLQDGLKECGYKLEKIGT